MSTIPPDLEPDFLLRAYTAGYFPMDDGAHAEGDVLWYDPDPRAVLPLETLRVPRSVRRVLARRPYDLRIDSAFGEVIESCSAPRDADDGVWISRRFVAAYTALHVRGLAHSFEAWSNDGLVAGLYGVAIGRAFMAESMFHRAPDAGNVVLACCTTFLRDRGFELFDVQFATPHLERFGVVEIAADEYRRRLDRATRS